MDRVRFFRGQGGWAGALVPDSGNWALSWGAVARAADHRRGGPDCSGRRDCPAIPGAPGSVVTRVFVHPGQQVKAGTLLMTTAAQTPDTDPALARKQLQVAQELSVQQVEAQIDTVALAQSRYDQAKTALAAYQGLSTIVSRKEMDGYVNAAGDAAKALAAEQARLKVVKAQAQGNLNSARRQLEGDDGRNGIARPG